MKTPKVLSLLIIIALMSVISCNSQECRFCDEKQQGAVYQNIRCEADTSVFYNIYVPAGTGDKRLPVLILLDAHGNTAPALKQYTGLADKYGVVLAGFNASENNIPFENIWKSFKPWIHELFRKAPVDSTHVFIAGFSGGARVTTLLENRMNGIAATALCGAGPADINSWAGKTAPVMMFAGTGDFNYIEINSIFANAEIKRPRTLRIFQGTHAWPPAEIFEDFFALMKRLSDPDFSADEKYFIARSKNILQDGRPDIAFYSASSALFAIGNNGSSHLKNFADSLGKNFPDEFSKEMNRCINEESNLQKRVSSMFQNADTVRYFALVDSLNEQILLDSVSLNADVLRRAKAWCGIAAYSFSNQARNMNVPFLFSILRMYEYTEPGNPDMLILMSAWYAKNKECMKARIYLNQAKRHGFNDQKKLDSMKEFDNCEEIRK
ncbi:hypothetical protein DSECCO2_560440 [anaerobic digester metagenome]